MTAHQYTPDLIDLDPELCARVYGAFDDFATDANNVSPGVFPDRITLDFLEKARRLAYDLAREIVGIERLHLVKGALQNPDYPNRLHLTAGVLKGLEVVTEDGWLIVKIWHSYIDGQFVIVECDAFAAARRRYLDSYVAERKASRWYVGNAIGNEIMRRTPGQVQGEQS